MIFGGEVEIAGTPGQGTTVKVRIPVANNGA
jgi:signal transduction histidine kinase